jgi:hypothetical protein
MHGAELVKLRVVRRLDGDDAEPRRVLHAHLLKAAIVARLLALLLALLCATHPGVATQRVNSTASVTQTTASTCEHRRAARRTTMPDSHPETRVQTFGYSGRSTHVRPIGAVEAGRGDGWVDGGGPRLDSGCHVTLAVCASAHSPSTSVRLRSLFSLTIQLFLEPIALSCTARPPHRNDKLLGTCPSAVAASSLPRIIPTHTSLVEAHRRQAAPHPPHQLLYGDQPLSSI